MAQWINQILELPTMLRKVEEYRVAYEDFLMRVGIGHPDQYPGGEWNLDKLNVCPDSVKARIDQIYKQIYKCDPLGLSATFAPSEIVHPDIILKLEKIDKSFRKVSGQNRFQSSLPGNFLPQQIHGYFFNKMYQSS